MLRCVVVSFAVLSATAPCQARTWYISPDGTGDAPTIAAGLDSSAAGDTVLVAAGTYTDTVARSFDFLDPPESVTLTAAGYLKPGVTLLSEDGPDVTTIAVPGAPNVHGVVAAQVPGTAESRVVGFRFAGNGGSAAVLTREMDDAWWIRMENCVAENVNGGDQAGAFWSVKAGNARIVDCSFSNVTGGPTFSTRGSVGIAESAFGSSHRMIVEGCTFLGAAGVNIRQGAGSIDVLGCTFDNSSGVFSDALHTTVEDCAFSECGAYPVYMIGTGLSSGTVRRCTFLDGAGHPEVGSAGIFALYVVEVTVEDCRFERCFGKVGAIEIRDAWGGAGVDWAYVRNNVFVDITSSWFGAVRCRYRRGDLSGNTFVRCNDLNPDTPGAAIYVRPIHEPAFTLDVHHNIFAECSGSAAVGVVGLGPIAEWCNGYWDNDAGDTDGFVMDATSFAQDPLFCDSAAEDFTIQSDSPCAPPGVTNCGLVGALPVGCGPVSVVQKSWGQIKGMYR